MNEQHPTAHPHVRNPQQPSRMPIHRYAPFTPVVLADRTWPRHGHHHRPALVRRRPARRQPGADRPDDPRPQAAHVRAAGPAGLQGDRGRLPGRQPDRLRLRPPADRGRPGPRRRHDPGADPGPRRADRAHLRVPARRQAGDRAPLQLDVAPCSAGSCSAPTARGSSTSPSTARSWCASWPSRWTTPRSASSTRRSPSPAPSSTSPWRSATPSPTSGSPPPTGRPSSTCRRPSRWPSRPSTPTRSSGCTATWAGATPSSSACTRTTTGAPPSPPPSWATAPAPTASRAACSATASAPATSTWSPWA